MGTVLVVDDEFGIADLLEAILTDAGHVVRTAMNGQQGVAELTRSPVDVVFLDFMMPVMNGAGVLQFMARVPSLQGIPVVMMSSLPEEAVVAQCGSLPFMEERLPWVAFLSKPFRIAQVVTLVEGLLVGRPI